MEEKSDLKKLRNSMKFKDINSKFKNVTKISFSKKSEAVPKKKKVMFLEPKEIKSRKMKKTEIIVNPKLLEEKFKSEDENNLGKKDNKKKSKSDKLKKCHSINNNVIKMPELKSKVVNTTHYYIPILNKNLPKTFITNNNPLKINKNSINLKKVKTFDNTPDKKNMEKFENKYNIKNIEIYDKKENKKGINNKNDNEKNIKYEKIKKSKTSKNTIEEKNNNLSLNNNFGSGIKRRSLSKCEISCNTGINENKDEQNKENNNDKNIDRSLTNKESGHKHNNSVNSSNKENKKKDNFFKKFLCCLYG